MGGRRANTNSKNTKQNAMSFNRKRGGVGIILKRPRSGAISKYNTKHDWRRGGGAVRVLSGSQTDDAG